MSCAIDDINTTDGVDDADEFDDVDDVDSSDGVAAVASGDVFSHAVPSPLFSSRVWMHRENWKAIARIKDKGIRAFIEPDLRS